MIQAAVSRVSPATETKGKTIRRWQAKNTTSVICPVCGQTFVLCSAAQRYCSSACREKAREQCKARQEAAKEKINAPVPFTSIFPVGAESLVLRA